MSLSAAFEIGRQGLVNYQVATEVISENIANVNTPGYSRQRVILETAPPTIHNGFPLASGVKVAAVERYYDALLQKQLVNAGTTQGFDAKKSEVLQQLEPIFNEVAQDGLGAAITGFFNAWQDLSLNPSGAAERQAVLGKGQLLADQFNYSAGTLHDAIAIQDAAIPGVTDDINRMLTNVALLNNQIRMTEQVSGNANEMRDQRDYLVRQLGEQLGVNFTENSDGTTDLTATIGGTTYQLVTGSKAATFSTQVTGGKNEILLQEVGSGSQTAVLPSTGRLGALVTLRDTTIPGYLSKLDTLAADLADAVNWQHQQGDDLNGASGQSFFDYTGGNEAASITLHFNDPALIAAAKSGGSAGDNTNALELARLNKTAGFSLSYNAMVAQVGLDVQTAKDMVSQDNAFTKQLTTLRDAHSGVSLDEELTDLIKYQRSYQASAKLITTAGEMLDTLINMLR